MGQHAHTAEYLSISVFIPPNLYVEQSLVQMSSDIIRSIELAYTAERSNPLGEIIANFLSAQPAASCSAKREAK